MDRLQAERTRDRAARVEVRQDATLLEMQNIGYSDIGDVMEWDEVKVVVKGATITLKASHDMPASARRAIKSLRFDSKNRPSIEMIEKLPALKLLAAQAGLVTAVKAEKVLVIVRDARTGKELQAPVALPALPGDVARLEEEQSEQGARPVKRLEPGEMGPDGAIEVKAKEPLIETSGSPSDESHQDGSSGLHPTPKTAVGVQELPISEAEVEDQATVPEAQSEPDSPSFPEPDMSVDLNQYYPNAGGR